MFSDLLHHSLSQWTNNKKEWRITVICTKKMLWGVKLTPYCFSFLVIDGFDLLYLNFLPGA